MTVSMTEFERPDSSGPAADRSRPRSAPVGVVHGTAIDVVEADAVGAPVDLAVAGMFARECGAEGPVSGLRHLDAALGGALIRLRADGIFGGALGETMLLADPAAPVRAGAVLIVGMGAPDAWRAETMRQVIPAAVKAAVRHGARSAAFAPSLIDSGVPAARLDGTPQAMLTALVDALADSQPHALDRWSVCSGAAGFDDHVAALRLAWRTLSGA